MFHAEIFNVFLVLPLDRRWSASYAGQAVVFSGGLFCWRWIRPGKYFPDGCAIKLMELFSRNRPAESSSL